MGSPVGPTLANIIMTAFEDEIVRKLIESDVINNILETFNTFHPQIQFTLEELPDNNVHFLDLQINSSDIFCKPSHNGQYTHLSSFTPWSHKTARIRALVNRAYKYR